MKKWKQVRKKVEGRSYVEEFWNKNKDKLIEAHKKAQPYSSSVLQSEQDFKERFIESTMDYMELNEGLSAKEAIDKHLNSRSYKSQEQYYDETFKSMLKQVPDAYHKVKRNFKTGRFEHVDWNSSRYMGKVTINNQTYTKYSINTSSGLKFIYFNNSPQGDNSSWLVLMEDLK